MRHTAILAATLAALLTLAAPARAGMVENCEQRADQELSIAGCTAVIGSGKRSGRNLAKAYSNRGAAYHHLGEYRRAIEDYDQALRIDPAFAIVYSNRGIAYRLLGEYRRAIQDFDQALRIAADEIQRFRRDIVERTGDLHASEKITDQDLLREVMNTVGKKDRLGESIRCVVSVSMLTEGWDANTVTHILGIRAFGTQLLCEQVVGRGLRRQSYDLNEEGLFNVEYSDILGIPFDFTATPVPFSWSPS